MMHVAAINWKHNSYYNIPRYNKNSMIHENVRDEAAIKVLLDIKLQNKVFAC